MALDPYYTIWLNALILDGEKTLEQSLVKELQLYYGISREEAEKRCIVAGEKLARQWKKVPRSSPHEVLEFYASPNEYPFDLLWWHTLRYDRGPLDSLMLLQHGSKEGMQKLLDFGCGVGSHAIVFAKNGFSVTLADISEPLLEFARWRLALRGLRAEYIRVTPPAYPELPEDSYDGILAFDVLEHLFDVSGCLQRLTLSLKLGGLFCMNFPKSLSPCHPMHIRFHTPELEEEMGNLGLLFLRQCYYGRLYRKVGHPVTNPRAIAPPLGEKLLPILRPFVSPQAEGRARKLLQWLYQISIMGSDRLSRH